MVHICGSKYVTTGWNGLKGVFIKDVSYTHREGSTQDD
jgi:hypothetical protein